MKIDVHAIVGKNCLANELVTIRDVYDPKGLLNNLSDCVVVATLNLIVSKKGNFVAVLEDIKEI